MYASTVALVFTLAFGAGYCEGLNKATPTEPLPCPDVSGAYRLSYGNSCGKSGNDIPVTVAQTGCEFKASLPGLGTLSGTLRDTTATVSLSFEGACPGSAAGTATRGGHSLYGSYSGTQTGPQCCGTVAGTFTLSQ